MPIDILMPALSPTMEEGTLAKWLKKEGDPVKAGDVIAEIETDKATMEFEAIDEGIVARILVEEGAENVKVNTPIAILAGEGDDVSAIEAPAATDSNGVSEPAILCRIRGGELLLLPPRHITGIETEGICRTRFWAGVIVAIRTDDGEVPADRNGVSEQAVRCRTRGGELLLLPPRHTGVRAEDVCRARI